MKVFYWADGTWCFEEDLQYYLLNLMSDDYSEITVNDTVNIDALIDLLLD